jgi:hypothetical protein
VASIDQVSDGRFLFGIGVGWNAKEMEDHGTTFASRARLVRERLAHRQSGFRIDHAFGNTAFVQWADPACRYDHAPWFLHRSRWHHYQMAGCNYRQEAWSDGRQHAMINDVRRTMTNDVRRTMIKDVTNNP